MTQGLEGLLQTNKQTNLHKLRLTLKMQMQASLKQMEG